MNIELQLSGEFRRWQPAGTLSLPLDAGTTVGDARRALGAHAQANWPDFSPGLLAASAFSSEEAILRDGEPLPANGRLAVLPPVSGG